MLNFQCLAKLMSKGLQLIQFGNFSQVRKEQFQFFFTSIPQFFHFPITEESGISPEWNFYKYLVNHDGEILNVYPSRVPVEDTFEEIQKAVKKAKKASKEKPKTVKKDLKEEL